MDVLWTHLQQNESIERGDSGRKRTIGECKQSDNRCVGILRRKQTTKSLKNDDENDISQIFQRETEKDHQRHKRCEQQNDIFTVEQFKQLEHWSNMQIGQVGMTQMKKGLE